jgi:hypothetical protein
MRKLLRVLARHAGVSPLLRNEASLALAICVGRDQQLPRRLGIITKSSLDAIEMDSAAVDIIEGGLAKKSRQMST